MKLYRFSEERRKNLSVAQLRRFQEHPLTTEQIERLRGLAAAHKGIPRPANLRQQISDKLKNRTFLPNSLQRMKAGQRRRFESSPMPLETKLKIAAANKSMVFTDEHRKRISDGQKRRWAERRDNLSFGD